MRGQMPPRDDRRSYQHQRTQEIRRQQVRQCPEPALRGLFPHLVYADALGIAEALGEPRAANLVLLGALAAVLEAMNIDISTIDDD